MGEAANYIVLAIPVFFLLIGVELLVAKLRRTPLYRFNDALTNISCGIGQQITGAFLKTVLGIGYVWLYNHARIWTLEGDQWWVWVVCFIGTDFFYYWFHRYAHEISLLWGGHIVHHQSEEYNLSVALRQGAFQPATSWIFYLPLAVIGFSPIVFVVMNQFMVLYQFWIHTRAIDRMPAWFEYIFNTPSHHRVHHGVNPQYIDKNHGGTLIIWDRMFGTFQAEEEPVVYGVTKPLASWNPIWANLDYLRDMLRLMRQCRGLGDMLRILYKGPGWRPSYLGGPLKPGPVRADRVQKYDTAVSPALNAYVLGQYVVVLGAASLFLFSAEQLAKGYPGWQGMALQLGLAALILASIVSLGGLLEGKRWAPAMEVLRVLLTASAAVGLGIGTPYLLATGIGAGVYAGLSLPLFSAVIRTSAPVTNLKTRADNG
jgi:sterol desaturase/sphingolipid hydroxylase (fatty acid hydroxylase superfamily)